MRRHIALTLTLAFVAAACSGTGSTTSTTTGGGTGTTRPGGDGGISVIADRFDPNSISFIAALDRFDACDDVLDHFRAQALARVGPYGLEGGGGFFPVLPGARAFEEDAVSFDSGDGAPATTGAASTGGEVGVDFSGTNVQVTGVDEPDIVKTDGDIIVAVLNNTLYIVDADGAEVMGTLTLDGWDHKMFLSGDRVIVFARGDFFSVFEGDPEEADAAASSFSGYQGPLTLVYDIDISDRDEPTLESTLQIEGNFLSARSIDGVVRLVMSSFPSDLPFVYPSNQAAEDSAEAANRSVIENSTLETWLPSYVLLDSDGKVREEGLWVECNRVHAPAEFAGFETLSVGTIDLSADLEADGATAVIAQGQTVYASTESLYVATTIWVPETLVGDERLGVLEDEYSTAIHKFDISDGPADYRASGAVDGHLLNQFSMDEFDGFLRIATTDGAPWGFGDESESFITVLQERDGALSEVGRVGEMGRGERIFSVRFMGEVAYVVTFRQVDPFYVIDLSEPEAPEVVGELKIPGFSSYLHPIGDDMILGVGQNATEDGFTTGAKVSLFDVSDPSDPREVGVWTQQDGYTDVEWDHHAFLYWNPETAAVLPLQAWSEGFFGAVVLKTDDGLREFGRVEHVQDGTTPGSDCRQVDPADLGAEAGEFEPGLIVQLCGPDDKGGFGGDHFCEVMPAEELQFFIEEEPDAAILEDLIEDGDRLEVCFPENGFDAPILRSLMIGDTLWTLSWRSLQANDISTLEVLDYVSL